MTTRVFRETHISLTDGTRLRITSLKIYYLRRMMDKFDKVKHAKSEDEVLDLLLECVAICMEQFYPEIATKELTEENIDMDTMYVILDYAAGIDLNPKKEIADQAKEDLSVKKKDQNNESWEDFDLAKYEATAFLLGIWKNYDELEMSMSLPELTETLSVSNEQEYNNRKFFAAIQGVDLDAGNKKNEPDPWEAMKARVASKASGIQAADPNDIVSFNGLKARQNGFGIGMGLDYEKM